MEDYWGLAYADRPCDKIKDKKFLDPHARKCHHLLKWFLFEAPEIEACAAAIKHAKHPLVVKTAFIVVLARLLVLSLPKLSSTLQATLPLSATPVI